VSVGAAGGGAALAVASVPDSNGVISACYPITTNTQGQTVPVTSTPGVGTPPYLRVIDPSAGQTCDTATKGDGLPPNEANLTWNRVGRRGPTGPAGKSVTIAGGHTLTINGGTVITVGGSSRGVTINTPPLTRNSKSIGTLTLDLGGSKLSFDVFSFNVPTAAHGTGGGGGAGKVKSHEFVITKKLDKASPQLAKFCASGQHIKQGVLTVRKAGKGQQEFLKITLDQVLVSSYQAGGSGHSETPTESLSFNFSKIEFKYTPQK
jgi:type VI secretion system secreted protein Hcp